VQSRRGAREIQLFCKDYEVSEVTQIHVDPSLLNYRNV